METSSKHISLGGLSDTLGVQSVPNDDADIIRRLEEQEQNEKISEEQKEILKLMVSNREQTQYKKALTKTIEDIRAGKVEEGK